MSSGRDEILPISKESMLGILEYTRSASEMENLNKNPIRQLWVVLHQGLLKAHTTTLIIKK